MGVRFKYLSVFLLSLVYLQGHCQIDVDQPAAPTLLLATINQDNGYTDLLWTANTEPDLAGYAVYYFRNGEGYIIDSVFNPSATSYSFLNFYSAERAECYVIAAFDESRNISTLSNELCTIHSVASPDPCNNIIRVSWTGYESFPYEVLRYDIMVSENSGPYTLAGQTGIDEKEVSLSNITEGVRYNYFTKAILQNGQFSASDTTSAIASLSSPPGWINADNATVTDDDEVEISFHIDPSSDIDTFALERRTGFSGLFQQINLYTDGDTESLSFTDRTTRSGEINFYRLSAVLCRKNAVTSNTASNINLALTNNGEEIILKWNAYRQWRGSISSYTILADTGNDFEYEASVSSGDTIYALSVPGIMYKLNKEELCFKIKASEAGNPYGISGESLSVKACTSIGEIITVPNIFTPDGDGVNDLFRPVMTFKPSEYSLTIADRRRNILFETRDYTESWDGNAGGLPAPQDVVIWFLRISSPSGRTIDRTGTLTIVRRK